MICNRSRWTSEGTGLRGEYREAGGNRLGTVTLTGRRTGRFAVWDGPRSSGFLEREDDGDGAAPQGRNGAYHFTTENPDGSTTDAWRTYDTTAGGYTEHGTCTGGGSLPTSYVGWAHAGTLGTTQEGNGESEVTTELGTERNPDGTTTETTISVESHLDGTSRFERFGNGSDGSKETTYGATDRAGNSSYSSRVAHPDGSVTLTTRTVDLNGNGQEQTTKVAADGSIISDDTTPVGPDSAPPPSKDGPIASNDPSDPNEPQEPGQPEHTDTGMPPDDGGEGDDSPPVPRGLAGRADPHGIGGFVAAAFGGRTLDDDEATPARRIQALLGHLGAVAAGDGSAMDDGVGQGIVIDMPLDPPPNNDDGWDGTTNPRALVALAGSLMTAMQGLAGVGNMLRAASARQERRIGWARSSVRAPRRSCLPPS